VRDDPHRASRGRQIAPGRQLAEDNGSGGPPWQRSFRWAREPHAAIGKKEEHPAEAGGYVEELLNHRPINDDERNQLRDRYQWEVVGPNPF
jgi:hypothetical protein